MCSHLLKEFCDGDYSSVLQSAVSQTLFGVNADTSINDVETILQTNLNQYFTDIPQDLQPEKYSIIVVFHYILGLH